MVHKYRPGLSELVKDKVFYIVLILFILNIYGHLCDNFILSNRFLIFYVLP